MTQTTKILKGEVMRTVIFLSILTLVMGSLLGILLYKAFGPTPPAKIGTRTSSVNYTGLPPGYKILCAFERSTSGGVVTERKIFAVRMPYGTILTGTFRPIKSREEAIDKAWKQYFFVPPSPEKYQWQECEERP